MSFRTASDEETPVSDERFRRLMWRHWIDDPLPRLGANSPRAAPNERYRDELERLLRGIEHRSACERADGLPGPKVAWLRAELGLDTSRCRCRSSPNGNQFRCRDIAAAGTEQHCAAAPAARTAAGPCS
jgi:hypothetical protein